MSYPSTDETRLGLLEDRLRRAQAVTPQVLSELIASACVRCAGTGGVASAGIERLIRSEAWTDAVLALAELELPQWQVRRLAFDGGEWHCSFSQQPRLPTGLDEVAEASHESLPLAILMAFMSALRQRPTATGPRSRPVPPVRATTATFVCCDDFA